MNEHMRVGHRIRPVRQAAGLFVRARRPGLRGRLRDRRPRRVRRLVRDLRGTETRRSTVRDTPLLLGVHRPLPELLGCSSAVSGRRMTARGPRGARASPRARRASSRAGSTAPSARSARSGGRRSSSDAATAPVSRCRRTPLPRLHRRLGPGDPGARPSGGRRRRSAQADARARARADRAARDRARRADPGADAVDRAAPLHVVGHRSRHERGPARPAATGAI